MVLYGIIWILSGIRGKCGRSCSKDHVARRFALGN
jgi:hypothetical protein